jgi:hypothetical protein
VIRSARPVVLAVVMLTACAPDEKATMSGGSAASMRGESALGQQPRAGHSDAPASEPHDPWAHARIAPGMCQGVAVNRSLVAWSSVDAGVVSHFRSRRTWSSPIPYHVHVSPKSGAPRTEIAGPTGDVFKLALDEEHLYWIADGPGRVRHARLDDRRWGGLAAGTSSRGLTALAVDDTHVFWIDEPAGRVMRVPKRGGPTVVLADRIDEPASLVLDVGDVYWTARAPAPSKEPQMHGPRIILRAPKSGGAAMTVVRTPFPETPRWYSSTPIAVDEGFVYWAADGALWRAPKIGGVPKEVCRGIHPHVTGIVVGHEEVFLVDAIGNVDRISKAGGPAVKWASFECGSAQDSGAAVLALDDTALWVCAFRGLYRLPLGRE